MATKREIADYPANGSYLGSIQEDVGDRRSINHVSINCDLDVQVKRRLATVERLRVVPGAIEGFNDDR